MKWLPAAFPMHSRRVSFRSLTCNFQNNMYIWNSIGYFVASSAYPFNKIDCCTINKIFLYSLTHNFLILPQYFPWHDWSTSGWYFFRLASTPSVGNIHSMPFTMAYCDGCGLWCCTPDWFNGGLWRCRVIVNPDNTKLTIKLNSK